MKLLIAGGTGFLGRQLIATALEKGHQVTYLARHQAKDSVFARQQVTFLKVDLLKDDQRYLPIDPFDVMIDCVGAIKPSQLESLNVQATKSALKIGQESQVKTFVYISASGGYPAYVRSKRRAEELVKSSGINYLIVRPGLLFGADRPNTIFQAGALRIVLGLPLIGAKLKHLAPVSTIEVANKIFAALEDDIPNTLLTFELQKNP